MNSLSIAPAVALWLLTVACQGPNSSTTPPTPSTEATEGADEKLHNKIKWSTASELDNFGFDVYRGDSEDGPFVKLTVEPVLGAGTTDETSHYEFIDDTVDPDKVYWYYVESISVDGVTQVFTPIQPSKPKSRDESP